MADKWERDAMQDMHGPTDRYTPAQPEAFTSKTETLWADLALAMLHELRQDYAPGALADADGPNAIRRLRVQNAQLRDGNTHETTAEHCCVLCKEGVATKTFPVCETCLQHRESVPKDEFAWLIELQDGSLYFAPGYRKPGKFEWASPNPNHAIRFARKEDAERVIANLLRFNTTYFHGDTWIATEHGWCDSAVKSNEQPSAPASPPLSKSASSTDEAGAGLTVSKPAQHIPGALRCEKHGVTFAFDGDTCWACQEESNAPINS